MKVTLVLPARNEEQTIGNIIREARRSERLDEILVVDSQSVDSTAQVAEKAGARVIPMRKDKHAGKGGAIKLACDNAIGDILVFIDADLHCFEAPIIDALTSPIIKDIADYTILSFERHGGRITELLAKPMLSIFFPEITFTQPLSGEYAIRKNLLRKFKIKEGWGVETALIIDVVMKGYRAHEVKYNWFRKHDMKPLKELTEESRSILETFFIKIKEYNRFSYGLSKIYD